MGIILGLIGSSIGVITVNTIHKKIKYGKDGYDKKGYDKKGYDKEGYNRSGYDKEGYDKAGYNQYGYYKEEYDKEGYDWCGYNRSRYNRNGIDVNGKTYDDYLKLSEELERDYKKAKECLPENKLENIRFYVESSLNKLRRAFRERKYACMYDSINHKYYIEHEDLSSYGKSNHYSELLLTEKELLNHMDDILKHNRISKNQFIFLVDALEQFPDIIRERFKNRG